MKRTKLKKPSDYPQFAFRLSQEDKDRLMELVDEVHEKANFKLADDDLKIKRNELILDALFLGLLTVKKKHRRL